MFTRYELFIIKNSLNLITHCGDYGNFYVHRTERKIFLELGDSDEIDVEELVDNLGIDLEIEIGDEYTPEDVEENWVLVSKGVEKYENYILSEGEEEPVIEYHPNILDIDEYVDYYRFFKSLRD